MDPVSSPDNTERAPRFQVAGDGGRVGQPTKPLRADAARNRERVLQAAHEAFAAEGLAVPLDEIARRAGVGAGTVYRHFPTKEALFEAVILNRLQRFVAYARELADAEDPGTAFFDFLDRLVAGAASSKALADGLAGAELVSAEQIVAAKRDMNRAGAKLLARAQKVGAVRADVGIDGVMALFTATTVVLQQPGGDALRATVFAVIRDGLAAGGSNG